MNVNFAPEALADLQKIYDCIAEFDEAAAGRVISRIRQAAQVFENFPLLGREGSVETPASLPFRASPTSSCIASHRKPTWMS